MLIFVLSLDSEYWIWLLRWFSLGVLRKKRWFAGKKVTYVGFPYHQPRGWLQHQCTVNISTSMGDRWSVVLPYGTYRWFHNHVLVGPSSALTRLTFSFIYEVCHSLYTWCILMKTALSWVFVDLVYRTTLVKYTRNTKKWYRGVA